MRDFDKNPYSPDEERIAKFFFDKGIGGGDDPIGFLIASYEYMVEERNSYRSSAINEFLEESGINKELERLKLLKNK